MQAPLSNTASGKDLGREPIHAVLNANTQGTVGGWKQGSGKLTLQQGSRLIAEGAGLAHDAGNLLGALGLYSQLLARPGVLREEHRHYADELQMLSGRSRELIDRLLNPATTARRASQAAGAAAIAEQTANAVIPEVIERCRGLLDTIARRAVAVTYEAGADLPVPVPREALERILVNLTKNAAEASSDEGSIQLRVTCRAAAAGTQCVVLTVQDKGQGMSFATVKRLMERSPAERPVGARGIGFRVVRELVGSTGGQLRLESHTLMEGSPAERGTTVEIAWQVAETADRNASSTAGHTESTEYIPTTFSERHGLLAGHDSAGMRGRTSDAAVSSKAAGRMTC